MQQFILHAHFYQPERTNPWTGILDPEPSAAPFRDWNERVHAECYRANGTARIFDDRRRVERIVNNYERLSFNFGPTLLHWLERRHPETYAKVIDGDWRSASRSGHGNALAQAYNHMILPLANERDRRTQILWGLADFRRRFAREAEGMWLPETAADPATLDALVDAGVGFTVLAPHQAARVRSPGGDWRDAADDLDAHRAYRHLHSDGSGRALAVCFYDGALAQGLAFDPAAADAGVLLERIRHSAPAGGGVVNAALDGETFGHHHRFGELGLAYALFEAAEREGLEPISYATWLAENPPVDEVEIVSGEGTAWSCAHGVGRWYRDCGCATDSQPGWDQAWRTPLRHALDAVRDAAAEAFEARGAELLRDPWSARDDYAHVRFSDSSANGFVERHGLRNLTHDQQTDLWSLLESQRHAMVMYTSCGWFFADVAGIETVYVMRSAARVIDLLTEVGLAGDVEVRALEVLAEARSNKPGAGTGADVWRAHVEPSAVTPSRVASHLALVGLAHADERALGPAGPDESVELAGHTVRVRARRVEQRGRVTLGTSRLAVTSAVTGRTTDLATAAIHLGGLDFYGMVAADAGSAVFATASHRLWAQFPTAPVARLIGLVGETFPRADATAEFGLETALPQGRQAIVGEALAELTTRFGEQYARLYHDHRRTLEMLTEAGYELPRNVRAAAELTLATELDVQLAAAGTGDAAAFDALRATVVHAREQGYQLDLEPLEDALSEAVTATARVAASSLRNSDVLAVERYLSVSGEIGVDVDLARAQEHAYEVAVKARAGRLGPDETDAAARLGKLLGLAPSLTEGSGP